MTRAEWERYKKVAAEYHTEISIEDIDETHKLIKKQRSYGIHIESIQIDDLVHSLGHYAENSCLPNLYNCNLSGYSNTAKFEGYVIPRDGASDHYPDDYILNYNNYGIIFGEDIHWYEIGTSKPVLRTKLDFRVYEEASQKHSSLITTINRLGVDIISEWERSNPRYKSKQAIKEESDRVDVENTRLNKEFELLIQQYTSEDNEAFNAAFDKLFDLPDDET